MNWKSVECVIALVLAIVVMTLFRDANLTNIVMHKRETDIAVSTFQENSLTGTFTSWLVGLLIALFVFFIARYFCELYTSYKLKKGEEINRKNEEITRLKQNIESLLQEKSTLNNQLEEEKANKMRSPRTFYMFLQMKYTQDDSILKKPFKDLEKEYNDFTQQLK